MQNHHSYFYDQSSLEWEEYQNVQALAEEYSCPTSADFNQLLNERFAELEETKLLLSQTRQKLETISTAKISKPMPMPFAWKTILSSTSFWIHLCSITLLLSGVSYAYSYGNQQSGSQIKTTTVQPN